MAKHREKVRARLDYLLALTGLELVHEMTGEYKPNLTAMRKGRRAVPPTLLSAVEELAGAEMAVEPAEQLAGAPGSTATAIDFLQRALEALKHAGAKVADVKSWMFRRAPVAASLLAFSCGDRVERFKQQVEPVVRFAEQHPTEAARLAVQSATPPPARRVACKDDKTYREPRSGEVVRCELGGSFFCASRDCTVEVLGDGGGDITGAGDVGGRWQFAPAVEYRLTWGAS